MKGILKPPHISDQEKSPLVEQLLELIEQQNFLIQQLTEQIQVLKDEIARLKNQPPRPHIKPSSLEKKKKHMLSRKKRAGSKKCSKTAHLTIHTTEPIEPENLPAGSEFRSYKDFVVQDILIEPLNTRYRLNRTSCSKKLYCVISATWPRRNLDFDTTDFKIPIGSSSLFCRVDAIDLVRHILPDVLVQPWTICGYGKLYCLFASW
jgi:hypothetical protein